MNWVSGRLTKVQATTRPDDVWLEIWTKMFKKTQKREVERWKEESLRRATARKELNLPEHVPLEEVEEYNKILAHAKKL